MVVAEFIKLKRSLSWAVVLGLPLIMVAAGSINTVASGEPPADGWHTVWIRSVVFPSLFPFAIGVAILASLVWRPEHRGGNWNALMAGPTSSLRIVLAKSAAVAVLPAAMQVVLVGSVLLAGKLLFGLPGWLPLRYLGASALVLAAVVPLAVLQSALSMLLRSFAAPIAVAFVGAGVGVVALLAGLDAAVFVSPYALASRALQLGTGTFADSGVLGTGDAAQVVVASVLLGAVLAGASSRLLDRRDVRV